MVQDNEVARLAVDIGGTFTDVVLEDKGKQFISKVLTTSASPEKGVLEGVMEVLKEAQIEASKIGVFLHGTTLATNAIIERKGALTAMVTTEGFRDVLEIGYESRYNQYDVMIEKPNALVPRSRRFTVPERIDVKGKVLTHLDEEALNSLLRLFLDCEAESIAV